MNKMIKSVLCFGLAIMMVAGSFSAILAADEATVSEEMQNSMEVLRLFGFIPDYYDYNTLMSEKVTRADFVNTVAKLVGATEYTDDSLYYYDVPKNYYAYNTICALTEMGVINGVGANRFEPEELIEAGAAYKILLTLMGYDSRAESDGGYPAGYLKTARSLDIYDGSAATESLSRGSMLSMIYRAMITNVFEPTMFSDDGNRAYEISETETLLSIYHDIYYSEGVVQGAEMSVLDGSTLNNPDEVKIGDVIYKSDVELVDDLGEEVEYFYHYDKAKDERQILWAKTTGRTEVLEVSEDQVAGFDRNSFVFSYYDANDKVKEVKLDRSITVLYNGVEIAENINEVFELPAYDVKFTKEGGSYTTAIVKKADTYVVGGVNLTDSIVYDKANPGNYISFLENEYEYLTIRDSSDTKLTLAELSDGMVLSVFLSKNKLYMKVIASSAKVSGSVEKKHSVARGTNVYLNGSVYLIPTASEAVIPDAGENVTLYIDYKGNVAYTESVAGNYFAGYVYRIAVNSGVFEKSPMVKVFHQNGKLMTLDCAEKVICDGVAYTDAETIAAVFNEERGNKNSSFKPQLALLTLNSEGKITKIDTAYVNPDKESTADSLSLNVPSSTLTYKWTGFFEGRAIIGSNTVVFNVPPDEAIKTARDKDFSLKKKADFADNTSYTIETFKTKDRVGYEQFIILKSNLGGSWDNDELPFLVKEVAQVLDDEGFAVDAIVGYNGKTEVTIPSDGEVSFAGIKPGMLLRLKLNFSRQVEAIEILFDPENDLDDKGMLKPEKQTNSQFGEPFGVVRGYVNDVVDGVIKIARTNPAVADQVASTFDAPVLIYDKADKNKVRVGTFNDAKTYYNDRDECSRIIFQSYYGTPKMYVIYK